jgi:hypothetical protein
VVVVVVVVMVVVMVVVVVVGGGGVVLVVVVVVVGGGGDSGGNTRIRAQCAQRIETPTIVNHNGVGRRRRRRLLCCCRCRVVLMICLLAVYVEGADVALIECAVWHAVCFEICDPVLEISRCRAFEHHVYRGVDVVHSDVAMRVCCLVRELRYWLNPRHAWVMAVRSGPPWSV